MNYAMIRYIIGWILNFEAAFMSPSFVVGLIYREKSAWAIFATMLLCLVIGVPMVLLKRPKQAVFYAKDGFVSVGLSWVVLSVMGALPFVISGSIPHPVDALFETVSGFTMWRLCRNVCCSGGASLTGSAEWACWSLC